MAFFMQKKFIVARLTLNLALTAGLLTAVGCSTVSVDKKNSSQTIVKKRSNVVTTNALSSKSASVLVSIGVPARECLPKFDECLQKIDAGLFNKDSKEALALYAELYLAKAKEISALEDCVEKILRPPIDTYYANAPNTPEQEQQRISYLRQCNTDYRNNLLSAIKYSYAYLFYNQLNPEAANTANMAVKPNNLPSNLDIQTQDVYEAASDALIKQLYSNKDHSQQIAKMTSFINSDLIDDAKLSMNTGAQYANGIKYGDQIKVLNFTFPPIEQDLNTDTDNQDLKRTQQTDSTKQLSKDLNSVETSIDLYLPNEPEYLQNTTRYNKSIDKLYASHDLSFSGLNTISEREGFGISYVTLFDDRLNTSVTNLIKSDNKTLNSEDPLDRIHLTGNLLLTGMILPAGNTLDEVLNSQHFDIKMYNPHHVKSVDILGEPYYLAANFSASYGIWLSENRLNNVGYFSLLSKQQTLTLPQLFMLEPYDPNKRVIIMLHGLASSPETWVSITNDISNDTKLRDNYQVWQIFYPTNIPILENRYRIQQLIETTYHMNDPEGVHPASHNSVLIGHSMGGVIGRMLVSNENLEEKFNTLNTQQNNLRLNKLLEDQFDKSKVKNRLHLHQLQSVDTAVFISAPFRGTDFADRWFTQLLRRVVQLPIGFAQTIRGNLASIATEGELAANPLGALYFENGASQLSDKSSFMQLTADLPIADNITYHSIIANRDSDLYNGLLKLNIASTPTTSLSNNDEAQALKAGVNLNEMEANKASLDPDKAKALEDIKSNISQTLSTASSDGIVPYSSSHLEGAASETIISGGHSIQETPEAVLTLRKILHQHLRQHPPQQRQQN